MKQSRTLPTATDDIPCCVLTPQKRMGLDLALRSAGECGPILESYLTVELRRPRPACTGRQRTWRLTTPAPLTIRASPRPVGTRLSRRPQVGSDPWDAASGCRHERHCWKNLPSCRTSSTGTTLDRERSPCPGGSCLHAADRDADQTDRSRGLQGDRVYHTPLPITTTLTYPLPAAMSKDILHINTTG